MSDIRFNCPHCQQRLGVSEAVMGRTLSCPSCKGHIRLPELPHKDPPPPQPTNGLSATDSSVQQQNGDIKFSCPMCEVHLLISVRAAGKQIACQHCGVLIIVPGTAPSHPPVQPAPSPLPGKVDMRKIPELIEKLRGGDEQAGKTLLQLGEAAIPALVEGLRESTLEEPDTSRGAEYVANLLVKFRAASVRPLIAKLGKSRHAYLALGRIGSEEAIHALVTELSSVNWHRVEVACVALGLVESSNALKVLEPIAKALKSTRSGEVYKAAGAAITAIRNRFPKDFEHKELSLQEKIAQSRITPLKAIPVR